MNAAARFSIYAGRHTDALAAAHQSGGAGEFEEKGRWVTGSRLFHEAQREGRRMAVLFGDTSKDATGNLLYHAVLTGVEVLAGNRTRYRFEGLTPIPGDVPKSRLIKRSDTMPLKDTFQRSTSIVYTPDFIYAA